MTNYFMKILLIVSIIISNFICLQSKWQVIDSIYFPLSEVRMMDIKSPNGKDILILSNIRVQAPCLVKSQDSGKTWQVKHLDTLKGGYYHYSALANELAYPDTNLAIAVCDSGYYFRSTDNGETWSKLQISNKNKNWHVNFWDNKIGIIEQYKLEGENALFNRLKTTDGGLTWFDIPVPKRNDSLIATGLHFFKNGLCYSTELSWLPGDSAFYIHKSTDYGETWESYKSADYPPSGTFYFVNENFGFCLGSSHVNWQEPMDKFIRKSTDAGKTWKVVFDTNYVPLDPVIQMDFYDTLNGVATTYGSVIRTTNGGDSWYVDTTYNYKNFRYGMHRVIMIDKYKSVGIASWNWPYIYRYVYDGGTSVKDFFVEYNIITYPNPAKEELRFLFAEDFHFNDFIIYNSKGDMVMKGVFDPATDIINQKLDIGNLAKGAYYIKLTKPGITAYSQFIKE